MDDGKWCCCDGISAYEAALPIHRCQWPNHGHNLRNLLGYTREARYEFVLLQMATVAKMGYESLSADMAAYWVPCWGAEPYKEFTLTAVILTGPNWHGHICSFYRRLLEAEPHKEFTFTVVTLRDPSWLEHTCALTDGLFCHWKPTSSTELPELWGRNIAVSIRNVIAHCKQSCSCCVILVWSNLMLFWVNVQVHVHECMWLQIVYGTWSHSALSCGTVVVV